MLVDFKKMIKMTVMMIMPYMLMIQHLGSAEWLCLNLWDYLAITLCCATGGTRKEIGRMLCV